MTSDTKFTAFTCRATAMALGMVPLPPVERVPRRDAGKPPGDETILGKTRVRGGPQLARFRSRKGCRWVAEIGQGFETSPALPPRSSRRS
jgi:hypothetical protein